MARYSEEFRTNGPLSTLYRTWYDMKRRCDKNCKASSEYYYEKGIRVCEEWNDWPTFAEWALTKGWKKGLEIDRLDNSLGYYPDNCKFSNHLEQNNNRDLKSAHRKIKESQIRRWAKPFLCVDTGQVFKTQIEAQRMYGIDRKSLRLALSGKYKQAGGYRWSYTEAS